uniref:Citrate transporter-like domain-containing protein n=1 Tax=Zooxanthella nutricula TaxID=1333877 RepID=A0A7S2K5X7_9DINO
MVGTVADGGASEGASSFSKAIFLGIAYSASCGGLGSLIGTATNGVLALNAERFDIDIDFVSWLGFGMPLAILMIFLLWGYMLIVFKASFSETPAGAEGIREFQRQLGPVCQAEIRVGVLFLLLAGGWCVRKSIVTRMGLPRGMFEDDTLSILVMVLLFVVPAKFKDGQVRRLMDWSTLVRTPWHLLFLFGGGFALAKAFQLTGLSRWLGGQCAVLAVLPPVAIVFVMVVLVTFLTEVTSNTATANVLLPIIGQTALAMGLAPALLMIPATLAASCAFMLPVATPPNAIVFGTGMVTMGDMARTGVVLNLASAVLITLWIFTWGRLWFDLSPPPPAARNVTLPA